MHAVRFVSVQSLVSSWNQRFIFSFKLCVEKVCIISADGEHTISAYSQNISLCFICMTLAVFTRMDSCFHVWPSPWPCQEEDDPPFQVYLVLVLVTEGRDAALVVSSSLLVPV